MVKKLNRTDRLTLWFMNYEFVCAYEKLIFMIDNGIKEVLEKSELEGTRNRFRNDLVDAVYKGVIYYLKLKEIAETVEEIVFDVDFETGIFTYDIDENGVYDPFAFAMNSARFNDEWIKRLKEIYDEVQTSDGEGSQLNSEIHF